MDVLENPLVCVPQIRNNFCVFEGKSLDIWDTQKNITQILYSIIVKIGRLHHKKRDIVKARGRGIRINSTIIQGYPLILNFILLVVTIMFPKYEETDSIARGLIFPVHVDHHEILK